MKVELSDGDLDLLANILDTTVGLIQEGLANGLYEPKDKAIVENELIDILELGQRFGLIQAH